MARFVVSVRTPQSVQESFAYMADLSNFAEWDPGVISATQEQGAGPGPDSVFDVAVKSVFGPMTLRYETIEYESPNRVVARAATKLLTSNDTITVREDESGTVVTYDAVLTLNGVVGILDPLLGVLFHRIGNRAADGLVGALDGERVTSS